MLKRINFGKLPEAISIPNLIQIQIESANKFFQQYVSPKDREDEGIEAVLQETFPIENNEKTCIIEYISYEFTSPKKSFVECIQQGLTYEMGFYLNLVIRFRILGTNDWEVQEEKVYMGNIPALTNKATFIYNGVERVIINQIHRSPGIFFEEKGKLPNYVIQSLDKKIATSYRIIPEKGSWTEVVLDKSGIIYLIIDNTNKKLKVPVSTFLKALGIESNYDILKKVYGIKKKTISQLRKEILIDKYTVKAITNKQDEVIVEAYEKIDENTLDEIHKEKITSIEYVDITDYQDYLIKSIKSDPSTNPKEALKDIYTEVRPSDNPNEKTIKQFFYKLFLDQKVFNLGLVGRFKINKKFNLNIPSDNRVIQVSDIIEATKLLTKNDAPDDIDHLSNRRIKTVGELIKNQFKVGFIRVEKLAREKINSLDSSESFPSLDRIINIKAFQAVIKDFYGRGQLSQFMDQINPLAEMASKRRISALGPGGLSRERAGFEVRDIHHSHYGRICPIETPEGANIGLISSLSIFARVNQYGFIETPYRKVINGKVTEEIEYIDPNQEVDCVIAQANAPLNKNNKFVNPRALCRYGDGEVGEEEVKKITHMDVSPKQLVSPGTCSIPFLEHNDANRALMGTNMQRQAVPLLVPESPYVGTGIEHYIARDSQAVVLSDVNGVVVESNGNRISIRTKKNDIKTYTLQKFLRSNSSTYINQKTIVITGQKVSKGQVIADGFATENGELALGKNVLIAFMSWYGYNYEDAIIVNEKLVQEDVFTSIHISEAKINVRDTKFGQEEITRDIPTAGDEALSNIDSEGIIKVGTEVFPGDILVGKITPKSETDLTPEEKLLKALFGDKASNVKDSSLRVPPGVQGVVTDIIVDRKFTPKKDKKSKSERNLAMKKLSSDYKSSFKTYNESLIEKLSQFILGHIFPVDITSSESKKTIIQANRKVTKTLIKQLASHYDSYQMEENSFKKDIDKTFKGFKKDLDNLQERFDERSQKILTGKEDEPINSVKVYIAIKRKLSVGDKMAGRHGNKGIVSLVVPKSDLPFLSDGTPVDIILNPLGVPSRMNIGQIFETHLGWAAQKLNLKIASPIFDGVSEDFIKEKLKEAGLPESGKTILYDGYTGDPIDQKITVGVIYMIKLDHLVVNKIHARSVGPYSLVTQQPLGGKAQNGGQRFGEMEVWALEAYGAAYTLKEMLTIKSDDIEGRTKLYESIIKGDNSLKCTIPESFNVSIKEMQSLCLNIDLHV